MLYNSQVISLFITFPTPHLIYPMGIENTECFVWTTLNKCMMHLLWCLKLNGVPKAFDITLLHRAWIAGVLVTDKENVIICIISLVNPVGIVRKVII